MVETLSPGVWKTIAIRRSRHRCNERSGAATSHLACRSVGGATEEGVVRSMCHIFCSSRYSRRNSRTALFQSVVPSSHTVKHQYRPVIRHCTEKNNELRHDICVTRRL